MTQKRAVGKYAALRRWIVPLVLVLVLASVASVCNESPTGILPAANAWTVARPAVLWCGTADSKSTVEAHIVGRTDVVTARLVGPNESFPLYDDGTHGDEAPGDFVFTADGVFPYCHNGLSLKYGMTVGRWSGTLEVTLADGTRLADERPVYLGLVNPRYREKSVVVTYPNGLSATAYAFFVQDIDGAVFRGFPVATATAEEAAEKALSMLYSVLPDAFDFVVLVPGGTLFHAADLSEFDVITLRATNDVQHIGLPEFDRASLYGSSGRLRGTIVHPFGSIDFLDAGVASLWAADIGQPLGLTEARSDGSTFWAPSTDVGGQLASSFVSADGLLFGHLAANGDGTWRLVSPFENERYSSLELYAMGLLSASDVPPVHVLAGIDVADPARITAALARTVTIDDIITAQGGPREPAVASSPTALSVAFVVVQEAPFTDADYAYYSLLSRWLMTSEDPKDTDLFAPFFWATGGRGTVTSRLPVDAKPILAP